jgi:hypothetical protein
VADVSGEPVGFSTFQEDNAASATTSLLSKLPSHHKVAGYVGLFPCFTKWVNQCGSEHVEPTAVASAMQQVDGSPRVYGMFAHGELGPSSFAYFGSDPNWISCTRTQHSMKSIVAIHNVPK